jgi:hypothetical protein
MLVTRSFSGFQWYGLVALFLEPHIYVAGADYTPIIIMWSISDMVIDGAIAGILCYYLQTVRHLFLQIQTLVDDSIHQSRSGIKSSDNIIDTLIIFTVNTGAITCSASTAHLVFFLASPNTGVHFAFHFVLAKLYTNSLYASLNTRALFRGNGESNRSVRGMSSRGTTHARRVDNGTSRNCYQ